MYIYHLFFIHSYVDRHLGCFHVLVIVNSAAVKIGVHVSFQIIVFSRYMPRNGVSGSYSTSIFSFLGNSILFFLVTMPVYIPTNSVGGSPFLYTLSSMLFINFLLMAILVSMSTSL